MRAAVDLTRALAIPGWMTPGELSWLAEQASRAGVIVEIGCYQGRSTRAMADHTDGVLYAVDPWIAAQWMPPDVRRGATLYERFAVTLREHIDIGTVQPMVGTAEAVWPRLTAHVGERGADLIFIDALHDEASVAADIARALEIVASGGVIAGHDYGHPVWPSVARVALAAFGDDVQVHETIWWVTR
jgi:predicted O-methyltransferase YrrM